MPNKKGMRKVSALNNSMEFPGEISYVYEGNDWRIIFGVRNVDATKPAFEEFVLNHLSASPVAETVAALSEETRRALARRVRSALQAYADGDGVAVPDEVNIALATR